MRSLGVQRAFCRRQRSHAGLSSMGRLTLVMEHRTTQATIELYLARGAPPRRRRAMITLKREDAVAQNCHVRGGDWRTRRGRVPRPGCADYLYIWRRGRTDRQPRSAVNCQPSLALGQNQGGVRDVRQPVTNSSQKGRKQCHDAATTQLGRRIGRVLRRMSGGNCRSPLHTHSGVMPNLLRPLSLPCRAAAIFHSWQYDSPAIPQIPSSPSGFCPSFLRAVRALYIHCNGCGEQIVFCMNDLVASLVLVANWARDSGLSPTLDGGRKQGNQHGVKP